MKGKVNEMTRRFTARQAAEGEMLVRRLSEKARKYYDGTDTVGVYCNDRNDNEDIAVKDIDGVRIMNFEALQADFEAMQDELDRLNEE